MGTQLQLSITGVTAAGTQTHVHTHTSTINCIALDRAGVEGRRSRCIWFVRIRATMFSSLHPVAHVRAGFSEYVFIVRLHSLAASSCASTRADISASTCESIKVESAMANIYPVDEN